VIRTEFPWEAARGAGGERVDNSTNREGFAAVLSCAELVPIGAAGPGKDEVKRREHEKEEEKLCALGV
jgi:hypothetical protein